MLDIVIPVGLALLIGGGLIFWFYWRKNKRQADKSYTYHAAKDQEADQALGNFSMDALNEAAKPLPSEEVDGKAVKVVDFNEIDRLVSPTGISVPPPNQAPAPVERLSARLEHVADPRDAHLEAFNKAYAAASLDADLEMSISRIVVSYDRENLPRELMGGCRVSLSLGETPQNMLIRVWVWDSQPKIISNPKAGNWAGIFYPSIENGRAFIPLDAAEWKQAHSLCITLVCEEKSMRAKGIIELQK